MATLVGGYVPNFSHRVFWVFVSGSAHLIHRGNNFQLNWFSVLRLPGVGQHVYGHMLWRFQCPHLYWAKLCIKDLIEQYF